MKRLALLLILATASAVSAQTQPPAVPPGSTPGVIYGSESWTYMKPDADLSKYDAVLIRPTAVYQGLDAQFDGIEPSDLQAYADVVTNALSAEMPKSFKLVDKAGPHTIAMQVTILGAKKTVGGVATATRVLPFGLAANAFKSLEGKPGTLTGSLLLEVEFSDARTGDLLAAAVRRRAPDALNVGATVSMTDTVKAIAFDMAKTLREKMIEAKMPTQPLAQ